MKLTNLNQNTLETIMKKMNTMSLKQTSKVSKVLKKHSQSEINKRKKAAILIKKQYIKNSILIKRKSNKY